jgi:hypothetical protein
MENLPSDLITEILSSGRLGAADLARVEASCRVFRSKGHLAFAGGEFVSLVEYAAYRICENHEIFASLSPGAKLALVERCGGNWKKALRFLKSVEGSSGTVETTSGNVIYFNFLLSYVQLHLFFLNVSREVLCKQKPQTCISKLSSSNNYYNKI